MTRSAGGRPGRGRRQLRQPASAATPVPVDAMLRCSRTRASAGTDSDTAGILGGAVSHISATSSGVSPYASFTTSASRRSSAPPRAATLALAHLLRVPGAHVVQRRRRETRRRAGAPLADFLHEGVRVQRRGVFQRLTGRLHVELGSQPVESVGQSQALGTDDFEQALHQGRRLLRALLRRGRHRQVHHQCGHGAQRVIFHVRQRSPIAPPHQRQVQHGHGPQVVRGQAERLVVHDVPAPVVRVTGQELYLLVDDLRAGRERRSTRTAEAPTSPGPDPLGRAAAPQSASYARGARASPAGRRPPHRTPDRARARRRPRSSAAG